MNTENINTAKEPWFAVNLSKFFTGIGQIYSGRVVRGYIFICVQITLIGFGGWSVYSPTGNVIIGISLLLSATVVYIWSLFDAYKCSRKTNPEDFESLRKENKDPWLAVFLSQLLPGLGHMYLRKWAWSIVFVVCMVIVSIIENIHSLFLICSAIFSAFVCYHVYIFSPVRRETSKKLIMILAIVIFAVGLAGNLTLFIKENVIQAFRIPVGSMRPTLDIGDRIFVKKSIYKNSEPKRGDLIVFKYPENPKKDYIKRMAGLPNETIEIKNGQVLINGVAVQAPDIFKKIYYYNGGYYGKEEEEIKIPPDSYYVLGDNSANSKDSRYWGFVPKKYLKGKAYKIYWPPNRTGPIE